LIAVNARRYGRHTLHALVALAACGALAPAARAIPVAHDNGGEGGGGLGGSPTGTTVATGTGNTPVSTSGAGMTLNTISSSLLRHQLSFTGTDSSAAGQEIEIERAGKQTGWLWQPAAQATVASDGSFDASWATDEPGRFAVRAQVIQSSAMAGDATPSLTVTVYRQARATLYGPGFYGNKTACGTRLTKTTIGVANRTLPCGSTVSLLFRGRTLAVPVIDRGPYANDADWDLTTATADAIGMDGTSRIGAVMLPKVPASVRRASGVTASPILIGAQTGH
jgi:rare lipoprotein A (peptidoglycan hydrolase)